MQLLGGPRQVAGHAVCRNMRYHSKCSFALISITSMTNWGNRDFIYDYSFIIINLNGNEQSRRCSHHGRQHIWGSVQNHDVRGVARRIGRRYRRRGHARGRARRGLYSGTDGPPQAGSIGGDVPAQGIRVIRIVSGMFEGRTTGTPLCILLDNKDMRPSAYDGMDETVSSGARGLYLLAEIRDSRPSRKRTGRRAGRRRRG